MATTHVFIVDVITFKLHLEYLFAGTGAKDNIIDFNNNENSSLNSTVENNLVSMIADSQRVRDGDFIIFYLQQSYKQGIYEGKFYGIFKAINTPSFLDNNDDNQFLKKELNKSLTFRTFIEPYQVFPKGVTEWEALDEIKNIQSPNQMLWSLIYRKLKGNRGNTMITIYESERLFKLIREKNNFNEIILNGNSLTFNLSTQEITTTKNIKKYTGRIEKINILPRLIKKYNQSKAFESHLQAYIMEKIGKGYNISLDNCLLNNLQIEWIGNEVSCGVGMQRIDVMLSLSNYKKDSRLLLVIELKSVEANKEIIYQLQRYIDWVEQYYMPNRISIIQPILISKKIFDKQSDNYNEIIIAFNDFNSKNRVLKLKYIEFSIINNEIFFENINY